MGEAGLQGHTQRERAVAFVGALQDQLGDGGQPTVHVQVDLAGARAKEEARVIVTGVGILFFDGRQPVNALLLPQFLQQAGEVEVIAGSGGRGARGDLQLAVRQGDDLDAFGGRMQPSQQTRLAIPILVVIQRLDLVRALLAQPVGDRRQIHAPTAQPARARAAAQHQIDAHTMLPIVCESLWRICHQFVHGGRTPQSRA